MASEELVKATVVCFSVIFLVGIILIGVAVAIVERENYGLRYNHFRQEIETETSESGRYFAGLSVDYIEFTRLVLNVEFSNSTGA
mmetsp:Transcript_17648/g.15463  ORF Transcript_17648/g.15463 Transcript_17648/m.15463 type:complete len:85 (-) Transcript_17648:820-1074(-)